jgi:hypothetical protein
VMNIKVKKYVYKKIASIFIWRIDCTAQNILKLKGIILLVKAPPERFIRSGNLQTYAIAPASK